MTAKEMTEIFSVMLLAWPNAETFKGGIAKLGPTIKLWTASTQDIDFWAGQQAVMRLCKECKYPPTIAEFREKAKDVADDIKARISQEWGLLKLFGPRCKGGIEAYIDRSSSLGEVVRMMGGVDALFIEDERGSHWNYDGFKAAYTALIRKDPALAGGASLALPAGRKEIT